MRGKQKIEWSYSYKTTNSHLDYHQVICNILINQVIWFTYFHSVNPEKLAKTNYNTNYTFESLCAVWIYLLNGEIKQMKFENLKKDVFFF